ncbi:cysteine ABC transporter substrate-binding protein [Anaerosinus massiliensis]|uniref:cysteine ABC transporter substrate-binding protein n=1 Tax=Massilibacillus massiliensis TaxID=1806837 RepID=UPI000A7BB50B|nr:cysteine ABC transporter substrate-binding protein [Massilibacillus massiliensis]
MKKFMKTVSFVLALVFSLGVLAGCGSETAKKSSIEQIKERGKLRVAVFSDKPPFGFVDANGKNQGYDVYLAKRLAKDLLGDENKVEFVLVEAASRVEVLEADKVDITLANFTVTPERKEKVDFANPYMKVALGVVSPEGEAITSVDQLKGKKLIVNKGTTAETYFAKNYPDIELLKYDQNTEAFQALKDGRGAALAHDNTLVFAWARENKGFVTGITKLGELDAIAPAVKKGNTELRDWINTELTKLGEEKFFHKNFEETLKPIYGDSVNPDDVVVEGGVIK